MKVLYIMAWVKVRNKAVNHMTVNAIALFIRSSTCTGEGRQLHHSRGTFHVVYTLLARLLILKIVQ